MSLINQMLRDLEARVPRPAQAAAPLQGLSARAAPEGGLRSKMIFGLMVVTLTGAGAMIAFDAETQRSFRSAAKALGLSQPRPMQTTRVASPTDTAPPAARTVAKQPAAAPTTSPRDETAPAQPAARGAAAPTEAPAATAAATAAVSRPPRQAAPTPAPAAQPPAYLPPLPTYKVSSFDLLRQKHRIRLVLGLDGAAPYRVLRDDGQGLIVELERTSADMRLPIPDVEGTPLAGIEWQRGEEKLLLRIDFREGMAENRLFSLPTDRDGGTRIVIDLFQPEPAPAAPELLRREHRDLCRGAINLARLEKLEKAEAALTDCLRSRPKDAKARAVLAALLINGGRLSEAQPLLAAGLRLNPAEGELARLHARLLINGGAVEEALATLRAIPQPSATDLAFMAALEQRADRHSQAVTTYHRALEGEPHRGAWWLGLGISLEALSQADDARQAYRRAAFDPRLTAAARDYAEQRLRTLGGR